MRGAPRFAFDIPDLYDGIGFIPVVMGLFGISEILLDGRSAGARSGPTPS